MRPMSLGWVRCGLVLAVAAAGAARAAEPNAPVQAYEVGGKRIAVPVAATGMVEAGDETRKAMDLFVPKSNRLLAAFVLPDELDALRRNVKGATFSRYAFAEVARKAERMEFTSTAFAEVTAAARSDFGDVAGRTTKEVEDQFNERMRSLDLSEVTLKLGKPVSLGCLFSKPDAYGFGMVTTVTVAGKDSRMAVGGAFMRVRNRLVFLYVYSTYENEETVHWLRDATEAWADRVLAANR